MNKLIIYLWVVGTVLAGVNAYASSGTPPVITQQPSNATVIAPAKAEFQVKATGKPAPKYQWMESINGGVFTNIPGATKSTYKTPPTKVANNGDQFECVVSNKFGKVTSNAATLTVYPKGWPVITTQPANATVTAPATATFTVTAQGKAPLLYQWLDKLPGSGAFTAISGATSSSYTTPPTTTPNNGTQFECQVSDQVGQVTSNPALLTVNPNAPPIVNITSPANNSDFTAGSNITINATASENYGAISSVSFYNGTTLLGTSTTPPYSYTLMNAAIGTDVFTAVATDISNVSTTSTPVTVIVYNPPVVSITNPVNGSTIVAGTNLTITANASENGGTIASVAFYNGTILLGTSTTAPYNYTVNNITAGAYVLTAVATDTNGNSATSSPVNVTVYNAPVVAITSPTNGETVSGGSNLTITATASETNGTISSVAFYNGTTLLGTSTTAPYSYTVNNIQPGADVLTAVATDANGYQTTSSPVDVTVVGPTVAITSPVNGSNFNAGTNLTIMASASENNATISSVAFYNGSTLLGTVTTPPYNYTINTAPVGIYQLIAVATDNSGNTATSTLVTVTGLGQPVVTFVSPVNDQTMTTGSLDLTAFASEKYGSISDVAFYNGPTLLGTATSKSPSFTYSWTNIPAGQYNLTAVATDLIGTTVTSSTIAVTINTANFTYGIDNDIATKTDAKGNTTAYQYDNLHRLKQIQFADLSTVGYGYDPFGNLTTFTDQRNHVFTNKYDPYERLQQTQDPNGGITQYGLDSEDNLRTLTDANNNMTGFTYDPNGLLLTVTNALNFTTTYKYDAAGNLQTRQDANGNTTKYTPDDLNRLHIINYPDGSSVTIGYDAASNVNSMTDATGQTTFGYDGLNRMNKKTSPGNAIIMYYYDGENHPTSIVDQNARTITLNYDALDRLYTVTAPEGTSKYFTNGTATYLYDPNSNLSSITNPNGVLESYGYDALNRVSSAVNTFGKTVLSSYSNLYDIAGMIKQKTFSDGSWTTYCYNALNNLMEETKQNSSGIIYDYTYTYDPVGNRLTWTKNTTLGGFWTTDYLNMPPQVLTNMTNAGYGNTGNLSLPLTLARIYTPDAANRLSDWNYAVNVNSSNFPIQTDTYGYDNNGNRLTKQAVLTGEENAPQQTGYQYDFENRLDQLTYTNIPGITGTQTDNFVYNGLGQRIQTVLNGTTNNYWYDGSNIELEGDVNNNITKSYIRAEGFPGGINGLIAENYPSGKSDVSLDYQFDDLGSVVDTTASNGTIAYNYGYDAYGNLLSPQVQGDPNRYLFSTKEFDSREGMYYFGARYYDPEIGRWLTQDPLGFVDGLNPYLYVGNNPINLIDPFGLWKIVYNGGAHIDVSPGFAVGGSYSSELTNPFSPTGKLQGTGFTSEAVVGEIADVGLSAGVADLTNSGGQNVGDTLSFNFPWMGKYGGVQLTLQNDAVWWNPSTWLDGVQVGLGLGVALPVTYTTNFAGKEHR